MADPVVRIKILKRNAAGLFKFLNIFLILIDTAFIKILNSVLYQFVKPFVRSKIVVKYM